MWGPFLNLFGPISTNWKLFQANISSFLCRYNEFRPFIIRKISWPALLWALTVVPYCNQISRAQPEKQRTIMVNLNSMRIYQKIFRFQVSAGTRSCVQYAWWIWAWLGLMLLKSVELNRVYGNNIYKWK